MNLYLLTQNENNGYDTFDSMVISAENEEDAKYFSLKRAYMLEETFDDDAVWRNYKISDWHSGSWSFNPAVEFIGTSIIGEGLVCESFNAG